MKTIHVSREEMEKRISRYADLTPLPVQKEGNIPLAARDLIYSRQLLSVLGYDSGAETPINIDAPIDGAAGITITLAVCPPGQGPSLHAHQKTFETFTVLQGRFEFTWNDNGDERALLVPFDTISVPPRVNRAFRNIGDGDAILQVVISGGVHDLSDIEMAPDVAYRLDAIEPGTTAKFEAMGFRFTAHGSD